MNESPATDKDTKPGHTTAGVRTLMGDPRKAILKLGMPMMLAMSKPLTVSAYTSDYFGKNPKYYKESERFSVDDFSVALIRLENEIVMDYRMAWDMHMDKC